ncbi:hypothetical protein PGB90_010548 [Kerria lacca]
MSVKFIVVLCILKCCFCEDISDNNLTLIFKWNTLELKWPSKERKTQLMDEQKYIPENSFIRDFKLWKNWTYFTIPRWKKGIPITLARIPTELNVLPTSPPLEPYPSWSMQTLDDCFALQSVHSIDIDKDGQLWVLDSGMVEELRVNRTYCPPKLVIIDSNTSLIIKEAVIPANMKFNNSILTTMALEREKQIVYVVDSNYYNSGFIVYEYQTGIFKRFLCEQLSPDEDSSNINYIPPNIIPEFVSVSLNTERDKLYFSTFDSSDLLYVNVSVFTRSVNDISSFVVNLGKNGRSVKLISDSKGYMYFNIVNERSVAQWRESSWVFQYTPHIVVQSKLLCHWISSLDVDDEGYLWIVSNRFHDYSKDNFKLEKENIRIFRIYVPRKEKPKRPRTGFNAEYVVLILFLIIIGLIVIEILMFNTD